MQSGPFLLKGSNEIPNRVARIERVLDGKNLLHLMDKTKACISVVVLPEINPHLVSSGKGGDLSQDGFRNKLDNYH